MARKSLKQNVVKAIIALSGNRCAFPDCAHRLVTDMGTFIGELCHIEAASDKGPRFNEDQSEKDRHSAENLLLLCPQHHIEIDNDEKEFTVERLKQMKYAHEAKFKNDPFILTSPVLKKVYVSMEMELQKLLALSQEMHADVRKIVNKVDIMDEKLDVMLQFITSKTSDAEQKIYNDQLNSIKEIKKQGKLKTAIDQWLLFKEKYWDKIKDETKYRVLASIGMTYLDLHQKSKAAEYLLALNDLNYESGDSLAALCLGYAVAGRRDEFDHCFKKTIGYNREQSNLWVAYIERYKGEKTADEILQEIPESLRDSTPVLFHIGTQYIEEGKKDEGFGFLKKTLLKKDGEDRSGDTKAAIATYIIKELVDPSKYIYKMYTEAEWSELEDALKLLSEAWDEIENTEQAKFKWFIILNRGVVNKILGAIEQAAADLQKAYDLSHEFLPFKNLFYILVQLKRLEPAKALLSEIKVDRDLTEEEKFELKIFRARLAFVKGDTPQAIELMHSLLDKQDGEKYLEIATHLIAMCFELNHPEDAALLTDKLLEKFPSASWGYMYYGHIWKYRNDEKKSLKYFEKATSLLQPASSVQEIYLLASGLMDIGAYEKAIPVFERIVNKKILNSFSRGLIHAYYKFGDLQAALSLAENLHYQYPKEVYLVEIISNIYHEIKRYDKAIEIIEKFLPSDDGYINDVFSYRIARIYTANHDKDSALKWAGKVRHPERFGMVESFTLSWLFVESGDVDKGLGLAFNTRTRFFDEVNAHQNYINLCVTSEKDASELFPDVVRADCAVQIKTDTGTEKIFVITSKEVKGENVIQPGEPFAQELIGKKKDQHISINNQYGFYQDFTITAITDIYTYAFQESLQLLETRFSGQHEMAIFHAQPGEPGDPMEQFIKTITFQNRESDQELNVLYNKRKATIGMLATTHRKNMVMQLFALFHSADVSIFSFTRDELPAVHHALNQKAPIIVDITALISLFFVIRKTELLSHLNNTFIVSQSTIEELEGCQEELGRSRGDDLFTMSYEDGHLVGHTTPKEAIREHQEILKSIISWCHEHANIVSPQSLLKINREQRKKYAQVLGTCFYDTLLLSEEYQASLLSDDDNFKNLFHTGKTPLPFSTYQLAYWLAAKQLITNEEFDNMRLQFIGANFIYIPVSSDQLWLFFESSSFQVRGRFIVAVKGLIIMRPEFCAQQISAFTKKIYLSSLLDTTKEQVILYVFKEMMVRNDFKQLKGLLRNNIEQEFKLVPLFKNIVLELLSAF